MAIISGRGLNQSIKSVHWLENSHLRFVTKSLLCVAQKQALHTKYMTSKIGAVETILNAEYTKSRMRWYITLFLDAKC